MPFLPPNQQRQSTEGTERVPLITINFLKLRLIFNRGCNGSTVFDCQQCQQTCGSPGKRAVKRVCVCVCEIS